MAVYADFTFYSTQYLGTAIAEADFPALALRASAYIDRITFGRVAAIITADTETTTINLIKMAVSNVAEELQTIATEVVTGYITSETVGSHSVTYASGYTSELSTNDRLTAAANLWLEGTYLMFGGFNSEEYGGIVAE